MAGSKCVENVSLNAFGFWKVQQYGLLNWVLAGVSDYKALEGELVVFSVSISFSRSSSLKNHRRRETPA